MIGMHGEALAAANKGLNGWSLVPDPSIFTYQRRPASPGNPRLCARREALLFRSSATAIILRMTLVTSMCFKLAALSSLLVVCQISYWQVGRLAKPCVDLGRVEAAASNLDRHA